MDMNQHKNMFELKCVKVANIRLNELNDEYRFLRLCFPVMFSGYIILVSPLF
jgi:hypothetical protein